MTYVTARKLQVIRNKSNAIYCPKSEPSPLTKSEHREKKNKSTCSCSRI
uniref:Uncharacterized protein n=1 Tax=Arundo donax TaxID=35708 RepID=A0A0A9BZR1_ARUDO